jgi:hypothetical protein
MGNDLINLIVAEQQKDADGFAAATIQHKTEVFAQIQSVKRAEFYSAVRGGMAVNLVAVVDEDDFLSAAREVDGKTQKPKQAEYRGALYNIIRTYQPQNTTSLELYLQEVE